MKKTSVIDDCLNLNLKNVDFVKNRLNKLSIMRANILQNLTMENCVFKNNTITRVDANEFIALFTS